MVETPAECTINQEQLPANFDELVSVDKLVHGEHNPRRVQPRDSLRKSVNQNGLDRPLIVRPDTERDVYHITDGWQRYQAATDCGWVYLPVVIYPSTLDALKATESASIVREWSKYEWATYFESLAEQFDADSRQALINKVAAQTIHSPQTVRRDLDVMSLPVEIHPLLKNGPEGDTQQWSTLQNYNPDVRQYGGLWWTVASLLAREQSSLSHSRTINIAAQAVEFELADDAMEFVELAVDDPDTDLNEIRRQVLLGSNHSHYLLVPQVPVPLQSEEKQAVMKHCHQNRKSLSTIVTEKIESLADEITEGSSEERP